MAPRKLPEAQSAAALDSVLRSAIEDFWQRYGGGRQRFAVAVSGGVDSTVLAHASAYFAHRHGLRLTLLHVDHALFADSDTWTKHCGELAGALGVAFRACRIHVNVRAGFGLEGSARLARYRAIADLLQEDIAAQSDPLASLVLTAHQRDDQAETLLLRLLRGTGTAGLAGMASLRAHAVHGKSRYLLGRPLLNVTRAQIRAYALQHQLSWREDPLNQRMQAPRNRLRQQILPQLRELAPHLDANLARLAGLVRQENQLLSQLAQLALARCLSANPHAIDIKLLQREPAALHARILQRWLSTHVLPMRAQQGLPEHAVARALALAQQHTERGEVALNPDFMLRRYRNLLVAAAIDRPSLVQQRAEFVQQWSVSPLHFPKLSLPGGARLALTCAPSRALHLHVFFPGRRAYRIRPAGRGLTKSLRILLQEHAIPPWQRLNLPLVSLRPMAESVEIDCVLGLCSSQALQDALGDAQLILLPASANS
jgi:tRNA(Ile)-lysidine synthase